MDKKREPKKRPDGAIRARLELSRDCEERAWRSLVELSTEGEKFTIAELSRRAGVGRSYFYDQRRPKLREAVALAKAGRWAEDENLGVRSQDQPWRERALNCENVLRLTRSSLADAEQTIERLVGLSFDADGTAMSERVSQLDKQLSESRRKNRRLVLETERLNRSLAAVRTQLRAEQERSLHLTHRLEGGQGR